MKKRALISIYDKTNLEVLLEKLNGFEIIATGSSAIAIRKLGYDVVEVKDVTSFDEILNGRVKTLHPNIFAGILSTRSAEDQNTIDKYNISNIDVVVCNLYPFYDVVSNEKSTKNQIIENIDIGGVSLIRAAAKNHQHVSVLVDPKDYESFESKNNFYYAKKAFYITSNYDKMIFEYFNEDSINDSNYFNKMDLSYGENRHQSAKFLFNNQPFEQLNGKELSYNNILDIEIATSLAYEFKEGCCTAIKHNTPCGVGFGETGYLAYKECYACDDISIFGGVIGFNVTVDQDCAEKLIETFLEVIIAPEFTKEALDVLMTKKNLRVLRMKQKPSSDSEVKSALGGLLIQDKDNNDIAKEDLRIVTGKITDEELKQLVRLQKIAKYVKSNAIVLGIDGKVVGIGGGQTSRVDALKQAIYKMKLNGKKGKVFLASDAFFPFIDSIHKAFLSGVLCVIQPGGSIKDQEVIDACKNKGMTLVLTGVRHFKH